MALSTAPLRVFLLVLSTIGAAAGLALILISAFSADFRHVAIAEVHGTRRFGLFRYCFSPNENGVGDQAQCFLRTRQPLHETSDVIRYFAEALGGPCPTAPSLVSPLDGVIALKDFEFTTLILLGTSCALSALALFASICSLVSQTFVLAHAGLLLVSAMCALSGFSFYAYNNELKENQRETTGGVVYTYHFGWAFYYTGLGAALLLTGFVLALLAAALSLRHRRQHGKGHGNNGTHRYGIGWRRGLTETPC